jgi:hypothetical protein
MVVHATIDRSAHESLLRSIRNGHSFKFWIDPWIDGACIAAFAPELFAAVAASRRRMRMVAQGLPNNAWIHDITGGLTVPVLIQYFRASPALSGAGMPRTVFFFFDVRSAVA